MSLTTLALRAAAPPPRIEDYDRFLFLGPHQDDIEIGAGATAAKLAAALAQLDSPDTKVNGFKEGQFFYRAFLPRESWRDRKERLSQPFEVRFVDGKPSLTVIKEDWSDPNATDPKLIESIQPFESIAKDDRTDTCFIYAPKTMKLAEVYAVCKLIPKSVVNWYVFGE